ncbi:MULTISPECIES: heparan-alpha-glucosaminide N-acetyltransferase domain-containing protein [unclassified Curtobacterium]|uniref:heparan-alpha-glucosaminide N-acetyltransferase domain-containing protein n=1 Tax=unclassified Curtobacterium TaxID=257496 RepID=UPI00226BA30B|nr:MULTISPECIES: heparan-alpha-glucosaminide N-acetyltransferase domain-containing protein [unclassified Curtobacterium]
MTAVRPAPVTRVRGARLSGVDVARAVALLGMMAAHVGGITDHLDWSDPSSWSAVVNGRSSSLFAVLAGVSVGLVSGRTSPPGPPEIGRVRARLGIRAVLIVMIGVALMLLGTPVYVILPTYGVLFLLVLPALRWPRWAVFSAAGACALLSAPFAVAIAPLFAGTSSFEQELGLVYPVVTFLTYVLVGLGVARSGLEARSTQVALLASGVVVATTAYVVGVVSAPISADAGNAFPGVPYVPRGSTAGQAVVQVFLSPRDHSSSIVDVVGTVGVALAVIGLCSLLVDGRARIVQRIAFPLVAIGSMPLSIYALHLVVIAAVPGLPRGLATWWWFAVGAAVFAMLWQRFLGRGPLERLIAHIASTVPR